MIALKQAFWLGEGKKWTLCAFLEANCAGQKVNCAGNYEGLRNLASSKIFRIPVKGERYIFCYNIVHQHRARGIFKRWEQCCLQQMCQAKTVCKLISCSWWLIKKQHFYLYFKYRSTTLLTFCYHNQSCFEKPSSPWVRMQLPMITKKMAVCLFHVHHTSRLSIMLVLCKWFILFQLVIPQSQLPII